MTDINTLERDTLAAIAAAADEAALEQVRIAALGKSGSISGLLKTLGAMTPDERKVLEKMIDDAIANATNAGASEAQLAEFKAISAKLDSTDDALAAAVANVPGGQIP
jgi:phenylalanyl-tRNA synthetase alpha chain